MCATTRTAPTLICTVGDLKPGNTYHDPNGQTWMLTNLPAPQNVSPDSVMVVNVSWGSWRSMGTVTPVYADVKLGQDERGRLYASTYLNDWYDPAPAADNPIVPPAAQDDGMPTDSNI